MKVYGKSLGPQPGWPSTRTLIPFEKGPKNTSQYHEFNNNWLLNLRFPNEGGLQNFVRSGGTLIDVGCGAGYTAAALKEGLPNVKVIGIGAHDLDPRAAQKVDEVWYEYFPQPDGALTAYTGRADAVIETYGAVTYSENPVHALIAELLLLGPNSTYSCITSTTGQDPCLSVFGGQKNLDRVKSFFIKHFHVNLSFVPTKIESLVTPGKVFTDLLVRCRFASHTYTREDFETLCTLADEEIGIPTLGKVWYKADGSFAIQEKHWPCDEGNPLEITI